jgi:hypothetical protein
LNALSYRIRAKLEIDGTEIFSLPFYISQHEIDILRQEYTEHDCQVAAVPPASVITNNQHSHLNYGWHDYWIVNWYCDLNSRHIELGSPTLTSAYRNPGK